MSLIFIELIMKSSELEAHGADRYELEKELIEKIEDAGYGEVTGAGMGLGITHIDIEVDEKNETKVNDIIAQTLTEKKVTYSLKPRKI